jgi:uncharacterized membrane protein YkoI
MTKTRTLALAAGTLALLIGAGTAAASISGPDATTTSPTAASTTSSTSSTSSTEATDTTDTAMPSTTEDRPTTGTAPAPPQPLSAEDAKQIALHQVGGGQVVGVEQELEHGRVEWKIRIAQNGATIDVRVDATTGSVIRIDAGRRGTQTPRTQESGDDHGGDRGHGGSGRGGHDDGPGHDADDDH